MDAEPTSASDVYLGYRILNSFHHKIFLNDYLGQFLGLILQLHALLFSLGKFRIEFVCA